MNSKFFLWVAVIVGAFYFFGKKDKPAPLPSVPPTSYSSEPPSYPLEQPRYSYSPSPRRYFGSYPCTVDCSGHQAGYDWAEENGISDPDDCDGNSNSFIEGCQEYAEENSEQDRQSED